MKKMTPEELKTQMQGVATLMGLAWKQRVLEHIAALDAEAAQARERALEEAAVACETAGATRSGFGWLTNADVFAERIRTLTSKPSQEGFHDNCTPGGCHCARGECVPVEMVSEENGLLPKRRRREHKYGEERRGYFGSWVADCVRPGCEAFCVKNRSKTNTLFRQHPDSEPTDEPGPCEVEP